MTTGTPPARAMDSGYVVQYGASTSTSSPGSHRTANELAMACLPPLVTRIWLAGTSRPESRLVFAASDSRSAGRPDVGVYLWEAGSRQASTAASTMCSGVGKSGSPAPKPITLSPWAFSALALASTARVADGETAAMRAEIRARVIWPGGADRWRRGRRFRTGGPRFRPEGPRFLW